LIECLDIVVGTCTSVPHLACALGKPTYLLLSYAPDWRWLLNRNDSPWYPSAKLFRQESPGAWDGVFANVKVELEKFLAELS
jgi:ADP-heptose:LPS heptosyltransferase